MPQKPPVQYTIRGVPPELDRELRRKAHQRGISLNQVLLEELTHATGVAAERRFRSLKGIAGRWREDPAFDQVLDQQRQIDQDLWR